MINPEEFLQRRQGRYVEWRRHLHRHPELGFEEYETALFLSDKLEEMGLTPQKGLASTGIVSTIEGQRPGPAIGLRADMDALPIFEQASHDHVSVHTGRAHSCGHDGHMVMLLAAAEYLSKTRDFAGSVHIIFQPAEEAKGGGRKMIEDGLFDQFACEAVFGLHNWPGLPTGTLAVKPGAVMAAMDLFTITIQGTGSHAALPHEGTDTIVAAGNLIGAIQSIASRSIDAQQPVVISLTQVHGGDTLNALPEEVVLKGTVRALSDLVRERSHARLRDIACGTASAYDVRVDIDIKPSYPVTVNSTALAALSAETATTLWGADTVMTDYAPSMASEDFAFMLEVKPGSYAWIGNGRDTPLHNPSFDFNDDLIPLGARYWVALAQNYTSNGGARQCPDSWCNFRR